MQNKETNKKEIRVKEKLKGGLRLIVEKLGRIRKTYPNEYVRRTPYDYADQRALLS